jgi:hypothetical protein
MQLFNNLPECGAIPGRKPFPSGEMGTAIAQPRSTNSFPNQNCALAMNSLFELPAIKTASGGGLRSANGTSWGSKKNSLTEAPSCNCTVCSAAASMPGSNRVTRVSRRRVMWKPFQVSFTGSEYNNYCLFGAGRRDRITFKAVDFRSKKTSQTALITLL